MSRSCPECAEFCGRACECECHWIDGLDNEQDAPEEREDLLEEVDRNGETEEE